MKKRKMKSGRRKFGKVFAFAVLFATLAFVIINVGIASSATIQDIVSQPKIDLFVQKAEFLFTHDTNIDHSQTFDFEVEWGAGVWNPQNLNNVTYTIRTTKDFRYTNNYELYLNGTEICSILPYSHIGDNYTWVLPLENRYASDIQFTLGNETVVQDKPWADLMVAKEKEGNYTRVSITFTPRSDIDANLIISGRNISVSAYPPEFEIEESFLYYINFYCEADNLIQNKSYNFSVVVEGLNRVEGWFERPYGWSESLSEVISLPVSGLGSITVQCNVPVRWSYNPSLPKYTQSIQIRTNQPPIASFTYHPENPIVDQTITFNASNSTDSDGNVTNYEWNFGDGNTGTGKITTHSYSLAGDYMVNLTVTDDDNATNTTSKVVIVYPKAFFFDTGLGTYPSIMGTHKGEIKPSDNINVSKLYTYPCVGTGGHTESIKLYENGELIASGTWSGYQDDYHNITITPPVILQAGYTYNYTIVTGSYPQIIHAKSKDVTGGTITCTEFVDANGKRYNNWIPAIRLE